MSKDITLDRPSALVGMGAAADLVSTPGNSATNTNGPTTDLVFPETYPVMVPVAKHASALPVHRIYCIGDMYPKKILEKYGSLDKTKAKEPPFMLVPAGDLIFISHPPGHGPLAVGDHIECGIEGLGTLSNTVVAA